MTVTEQSPPAIDEITDDPDTAGQPVTYLSYSGISTHRKCPQAWSYRYLRRLTQDLSMPSVRRDLGSWWHLVRAMDSIDRGLELDSLRYAPKTLTTTDDGPTFERVGGLSGEYRLLDDQVVRVDAELAFILAEHWWRHLPGETRTQWQEELGEQMDLATHLVQMDDRWRDRWSEDLPHEAPVAVELKFKRELPSTPAVIGGYVDEVFVDDRRGLVVARDHKSNKAIANSESEADFMDSQLQLYGWGVTPVVKGWLGRGINALSYDRIRTKVPTLPSVTQSGTLSKTVTDFDLATYLDWASGDDGAGVPFPGRKKDGSQAGFYQVEQSVIDKLSAPQMRAVWADRTLVPLNRNVIKAHLQAAIDTQRQAEATASRFERSGQAPRNITANCRWCDYFDLCRAEMISGPDNDFDPQEYGLKIMEGAAR